MEAPKKEVDLASLPRRNKGDYSKNFKEIELTTNHYKVEFSKSLENLFIYRVIYQPFIPHDNTKRKQEILKKLAPKISQKIANPVFTPSNIYSTSKLSTESTEDQQFTLTADEITVKIKQVKSYNFKENPHLLLVYLNKGLKNIMNRLSYIELGKTGKYFKAKQYTDIDTLLMYNGYKTNFVSLQKGLYLRTDAAKKIVRNSTVLQEIDMLMKIHVDKNKEDKRLILREQLIGKTVVTNYGKMCYYQIDEIKFDQEISKIMFECNGKQISLKQYYLEKYQITINKDKQPLLISIDKKNAERKNMLIPQLMLMTGIPDDFDEFRRKKISEQTIKPPHQKMKEITGLMDQIKNGKYLQTMAELGIKVQSRLTKFKAKKINTPELELGQKNKVDSGREANFQLFAKPIFQAKYDLKVAIIAGSRTDLSQLQKVLNNTVINLKVEYKAKLYLFSGKPSVLEIQEQMHRAKKQCNIALIIMPTFMKNDYPTIKRKAIVDMQMVTQVLLQDKLKKKGFQSIATKVLLQMIAKRGNVLWSPKLKFKSDGILLVGYETSKLKDKTLIDLCGTINSTFSSPVSYYQICDQPNDKYQIMVGLMIKAVAAYISRNSKQPKQIVVFMSTCPGDQIQLYKEFYVERLHQRLNQLYQGNQIKLTIVMVNVKTSQRFFLDDGKINNVQAGTLVAQEIVSPFYDFYLMSQSSNRGTTVPNHYKVIYTNSDMQEGELQQLIFSQCFNYVNWTGSIKVPSVLQYTKKGAKFKSQVLAGAEVPSSLQNKLFFI